jgi:hypothetical protein
MFFETIEIDGKKVPRFEEVNLEQEDYVSKVRL